jgi:hypothetical protein
MLAVQLHSHQAITVSSMAGAGIGASLAKSLPTPFSPLLGGLAGAVVVA